MCESCLVCLRVSISRRLVLVCNHEPPSSSLKVVPLIGLDCKGLGLLISIVRFLLILARVLQIESLGSPSILSLLISLVLYFVESLSLLPPSLSLVLIHICVFVLCLSRD